MSNPPDLRPPEEVFHGGNLPEDLKWLMTNFDLPKDDPTIVFCAWHWNRVRQHYELINEGGLHFKSVLDPRLDRMQAYAAIMDKLYPGLDAIAKILGQDEATMKQKLHQGLEKPMVQISQKMEKVIADLDREWRELNWQRAVACFIAGMAVGSILILCVV